MPIPLRSDVRGYPLGDELVLFAESSGRLIWANSSAALIWHAGRDGLSPDDISALFAEAFAIPVEEASRDVNAVVREWEALGLLTTSPPGTSAPSPAPPTAPDMGGITVPPREPTSFATCYRLLDSLISLRMPDEQTAAQIHPMLRHLTMSGDTMPDLDLEVRRAAEGYLLLRDGVPIDNCHCAAGLLPMIHANLLMLAYDQSTRLVGIHSAAVKSGNCCLLLPALPGSGKSTLAAALVGSGFDYCADDLVLFNGVPTGLRSAPVAMGIKTGSWKPLMNYHSDLAALPISERVDGQHIRYLPPPPGRLADVTRPLVVSHVVFPRYREGSAARLTPISAAEGLWRLTEAGYDVQGRLTAAVVEQLIDWIAPIPCFEFRYGELPEAVTTVRRLCT